MASDMVGTAATPPAAARDVLVLVPARLIASQIRPPAPRLDGRIRLQAPRHPPPKAHPRRTMSAGAQSWNQAVLNAKCPHLIGWVYRTCAAVKPRGCRPAQSLPSHREDASEISGRAVAVGQAMPRNGPEHRHDRPPRAIRSHHRPGVPPHAHRHRYRHRPLPAMSRRGQEVVMVGPARGTLAMRGREAATAGA